MKLSRERPMREEKKKREATVYFHVSLYRGFEEACYTSVILKFVKLNCKEFREMNE